MSLLNNTFEIRPVADQNTVTVLEMEDTSIVLDLSTKKVIMQIES